MYVNWQTCRCKKESSLDDYCAELTNKGAIRAFAKLIEALASRRLLDQDDLKNIFDDYSLTIKDENELF